MAQPKILEGTWEELKRHEPELAGRKFRLVPLPEQPDDVATPPSSEENAAAIALLQSWLRDEATDDPEQIERAEAELAEFKRNMNANRAATLERLPFPE